MYRCKSGRTPSWPIIMELNLNVRGAVSSKLNLNQGKYQKNYLVFSSTRGVTGTLPS